jgi:epoxyqueuosine reductase QueG
MEALTGKVRKIFTDLDIDVVGIAPVDDWTTPWNECRPETILKGCRRIIVFGREVPYPIYEAEMHGLDLYAVASHNIYHSLDEAGISVAGMLTKAGFPSLLVGSYQPVIMRKGDYWGMVSLKHAAVRAGLGTMGKNSLLINREYGNRLQLGGVLTTAELPAGKPLEKSFCFENCSKCVRNCPVQALDGKGGIDQYKCLKNCVVHPAISFSFLSRWFRNSPRINKLIELSTRTLVSTYTYSCATCRTSCPHFRKAIQK